LSVVIPQSVAAELIGISVVQFSMAVREGWITMQPDGRYLVRDCVQGYVRYRLDAGQQEKRERDNKLAQIRIAERGLQLAERRGSLMNLQAAMGYLSEQIGSVFQELDGVPARLTRDLELRRRLADILDGIRNKFAADQQREAHRLRAVVEGRISQTTGNA
jgi:hypothetical protein